MVGSTSLRENSTNILEGEIKPSRNRGCVLKINPKKTRVVVNRILIYQFVDPDLRVEMFFEKEGATEKGGVDFEVGDTGTSAYLY